MVERVDVVDKRGKTCMTRTRTDVHKSGLLHQAVFVLVFNKRGEVFVQQRSSKKDVFPGLHEASLSGHVKSGETPLQAAVRETKEEVGLTIKASMLKKRFTTVIKTVPEYERITVYMMTTDKAPKPGREVKVGTFMPAGMLDAIVRSEPDVFTPVFCALAPRLRTFLVRAPSYQGPRSLAARRTSRRPRASA